MIHHFTARVAVDAGREVGIDDGGMLCIPLPYVTAAVGVARRDIAANETVTLSFDEDTDVRSYAILEVLN